MANQNSPACIVIQELSKIYRLYHRPLDRLKEALHPRGKSYHQDFFALKNVSLEVAKGRSVGIIGLNGSGKSTLLQIIAGVLSPSSGSVQVNGKIAALLELGAGLNPDFTGIENIRFQMSLMGLSRSKIEAVIKQIIDFADIGPFIDQPVKTYSSGMFVRLAFAISINVDPEILIVDEALAVGDIRFQAKCLNKIREFRERGHTLLFVSHDPSAVKSLCDEAHLLHKGQLLYSGAPEEVFNTYNSLIAMDDDSSFAKITSERSLARRSGNQKAKIERVELQEENGDASETFVSGSLVRIKVVTRVFEDLQDLTIGILIRDRFGQDMFGINNYLLGREIRTVRAGESLVTEYLFPLNLGENIYKLTVAAHSGENHIQENYDWIDDAQVFRVIHEKNYKFAGAVRIEPRLSIERH